MRTLQKTFIILATLVTYPIGVVKADEAGGFVISIAQSYYAQVFCEGVTVVNVSTLKMLANAKSLNASIVDEAREGLTYLNSEGKMGRPAVRDVMANVVLASKMISLDFDKVGKEAWCKHVIPKLVRDGFIGTYGRK